jgi:rhodanese-related sulfurtransferase
MFKYTFILFLVLIGFNSCQSSNSTEATTQAEVKTIGQQDFKSMQAKPDVVVLDVRTPGEVSEGIINGSTMFIDYNSSDFEQQLDGLDKSKTYLVYCRSGNRSGKACHTMLDKGFKQVYNLDGGISAWSDPLGMK